VPPPKGADILYKALKEVETQPMPWEVASLAYQRAYGPGQRRLGDGGGGGGGGGGEGPTGPPPPGEGYRNGGDGGPQPPRHGHPPPPTQGGYGPRGQTAVPAGLYGPGEAVGSVPIAPAAAAHAPSFVAPKGPSGANPYEYDEEDERPKVVAVASSGSEGSAAPAEAAGGRAVAAEAVGDAADGGGGGGSSGGGGGGGSVNPLLDGVSADEAASANGSLVEAASAAAALSQLDSDAALASRLQAEEEEAFRAQQRESQAQCVNLPRAFSLARYTGQPSLCSPPVAPRLLLAQPRAVCRAC